MTPLKNWAYHLLRKSEAIFKTDMVYLAKGGFWLTFGHGGALFASFLLSIAFANLMPTYGYGTYKYILSIAEMIGILSLSGLPSALNRSTALKFQNSLWRAFFLNMKWGILMTVVSGIVGAYYLLNDNFTLGFSLLIAGALSPFIDSAELYNAYTTGIKNFRFSALSRICRGIITSAGLITTLFLTKDPLIIVAVYFILHSLVVGLIFYITARKLPKNGEDDPNMIRLGGHVSIMNGVASFADQLDNILVFQWLGPVQLAIYTFATVIPVNLIGFIKNIGTLALPKFTERDSGSLKKTLLSKTATIALGALPVVILYIIFAPTLFSWFFPQYMSSVNVSRILALMVIINGSMYMAYLDSKIAIREKYLIVISSSIFKIAALSTGVLIGGLPGLAMGYVASKLFGLLSAIYFTRKV